jgi:hypothetical protein
VLAAVGLPLLAFAGWWLASGGHVLQAVGYRASERADVALWIATHGLAGATFAGGLLGFPIAMLVAALAVPSERGFGLIALAVGIAAALLAAWLWPGLPPVSAGLVALLVSAFAVFGASVLGHWPADALGRTLWLWLAGALGFVVLLNWTLNARSILLLTPPAVLLFARRTEGRRRLRRAALATAAGIGLLVCAADAELAEFGRSEAARVERELGGQRGQRVRFVGHWGFQHYMEAAGYEHVDLAGAVLRPGDVVVAPEMHQVANGGIDALVPRRRAVQERPRRLPIAVMDPEAGAGLHGSFLGPLPFAPSAGPLERVEVLQW